MNKNKEKKRELTHFLGHYLEMHYSLPYFQNDKRGFKELIFHHLCPCLHYIIV